jgi:hypothetical protein
VVIEGQPDHRGFVLEVTEVTKYFTRRYEQRKKPILSCEQLAIDACRFFARKGHKVRRVRVEIEADTNTVGFASAVWERGRQ